MPTPGISGIQVIDIPLKQIELGDRFRKTIGELDSMVASFSQNGLLHPIVVHQISSDPPRYQVAAGGRRFIAAQKYVEKNGGSTISCRIIDIEDDFALRTAELAENLVRREMTPAEIINLQAEIHRLHIEKYGAAAKGGPSKAGGHRIQDTAKYLGVAPSTLRKNLDLHKEVEKLSEDEKKEMAKATSLKQIDDFTKKAKKRVEDFINVCKAEEESSTDEGRKKRIDAFVVADFFKGVKDISDESIDFVELDPPYAIDLVKKREAHKNASIEADEWYNEVDEKDYPEFMRNVLTECYRVMKKDSWLVLWHAYEWAPLYFGVPKTLRDEIKKDNKGLSFSAQQILDGMLTQIGFKFSTIPASWQKGEGGEVTNIQFNLASNHEPFIIVRKGQPRIQKPGRSNVFAFPRVPSQKKVHSTERPIALMDEILQTFARPGDQVLVPFAGSGKTLVAAWKLGMSPLGFDLAQQNKDSYILMLEGNGRIY